MSSLASPTLSWPSPSNERQDNARTTTRGVRFDRAGFATPALLLLLVSSATVIPGQRARIEPFLNYAWACVLGRFGGTVALSLHCSCSASRQRHPARRGVSAQQLRGMVSSLSTFPAGVRGLGTGWWRIGLTVWNSNSKCWCRWRDLNPHDFLWSQDFKSCASAISPHRQLSIHNNLWIIENRQFAPVLVFLL